MSSEQQARTRKFIAIFVEALQQSGLDREPAWLLASIAGGSYCVASFDIALDEQLAEYVSACISAAIALCYPPQQASGIPLQA